MKILPDLLDGSRLQETSQELLPFQLLQGRKFPAHLALHLFAWGWPCVIHRPFDAVRALRGAVESQRFAPSLLSSDLGSPKLGISELANLLRIPGPKC